MKYLLDTNVCSGHLRGRAEVFDQVSQNFDRIFVSVVTVGELIAWGVISGENSRRSQLIRKMLSVIPILDVTLETAETFGLLHAEMRPLGWTRPGLDLHIAATALTHDLVLVTHNLQDFSRIPGLKLEDWQQD